jgi:hypothetical protein
MADFVNACMPTQSAHGDIAISPVVSLVTLHESIGLSGTAGTASEFHPSQSELIKDSR